MSKYIPLHFQILIGLLLGSLFGYFATDYVAYVSWTGDLFMRALKMVVVPLVLASIISGIANMGGNDNLGRLGLKTMGYYVFTSAIAILTGLFFVNLIQPGVGVEGVVPVDVPDLGDVQDSFSDTLRNIIPVNIFESLVKADMLPVIFFSLLFGFFITKIEAKASALLTDFFNAVFDVMMRLTMFIISFTPIGVFGMLAKTVAENANKLDTLASSLGLYMLTVIAALALHFFLTLPLFMVILGKAKPYKHMRNMRNALLTAFSTASSGATLSLTMDAVTNKSGVSNRISSFTLPLGATVNMDGTALYELVAALFIAQYYGIEMSLGQQLIMVITALLTSIGAAAIPMASLVMITVILSTMGLPLEGIGVIIAVDRILDMFRTATNVWSDSCGAVIIAKSEGEATQV